MKRTSSFSFHSLFFSPDTQRYYIIQEITIKLQSNDATSLASSTCQKAVIEINQSSRILDGLLDLDGTHMEMDNEQSESKRTSSEGYLGDDDDDYDAAEDMVE